jgi:hypothetical protein
MGVGWGVYLTSNGLVHKNVSVMFRNIKKLTWIDASRLGYCYRLRFFGLKCLSHYWYSVLRSFYTNFTFIFSNLCLLWLVYRTLQPPTSKININTLYEIKKKVGECWKLKILNYLQIQYLRSVQVLLEKLTVSLLTKKLQTSPLPESSLPSSQEPAAGSYFEPDESSHILTFCFLYFEKIRVCLCDLHAVCVSVNPLPY